MRTKSLVEPTGVAEGHEWISPDGHSPSWHRVFQDGKWCATAYEEMEEDDAEEDGEEEDLEESEGSGEDETGEEAPDDSAPEADVTINEGNDDEQGVQAEIPDRDGREQGSGGESGSESKQRGKRGQVRKGRKGK